MPFLKSFSTYEIRHKYVKKQQKKTETKPQISKNAYISQTNGMDQKWRVCTSTSTWVYLSSREQMFVWKNGFLTTEKNPNRPKSKASQPKITLPIDSTMPRFFWSWIHSKWIVYLARMNFRTSTISSPATRKKPTHSNQVRCSYQQPCSCTRPFNSQLKSIRQHVSQCFTDAR